MEYGILTIVPPLIAIGLALITKQTILSLVAGLWVGTTILCGWNPIEGLPMMISDFFIPNIGNEGNAGTLMLITACGGFVYMFKVSGASKAFGELVTKKVKTRKQAQLITYFSCICLYFYRAYTDAGLHYEAYYRKAEGLKGEACLYLRRDGMSFCYLVSNYQLQFLRYGSDCRFLYGSCDYR